MSNNLYAGRPSVCRSCGALVGAGEGTCAECGVPLGGKAGPEAEASRDLYDGESMRFARAVLNRPYLFTIIFLVANFFVFLLMWSASGLNSLPILEPFPEPVLMAFGAKLNSSISLQHEYWRLLTPVFIHINLVHLLVNMYSLWVVGPYVEKLYGSAKFVVFWVLTGIGGVVASYLAVRPDWQVGSIGRFIFKAVDVPSAGASGALFGLVGVLFVFGIKFRRELPEGFKQAFGTGLLPMIMINLFIGYMGRGIIDNAAHVGGFACGAVLALVVGYKRPGQAGPAPVLWRALQAIALLLIAMSFLLVVRHFPPSLPKSDESAAAPQLLPGGSMEANFAATLDAVNKAQAALVKALDEGDASDIDEALAGLDAAPHVDDETDAVRRDLKSLLVRAKTVDAATPAQTKNARARVKERNKIALDFLAWHKQGYEKWTNMESEKYGITLKENPPPPERTSPESK